MSGTPPSLTRKLAIGLTIPALAIVGVATGSVLSADAADPVAAMSASPNPLTYDDVAVGASKDATITLTSGGSAPLAVSDVANTGRDASQYSIVSDQCSGKTLAPGSTCPVVLRFSPQSTKTLVTAVRFRSSNACATYIQVAGGGTTQSRDAARATTRAAAPCDVVTSTVTTTTPATTAPAQTVTTTSTVTSSGAASSSPAPAPVPGVSSVTATGAVAGVTASSPKVCKSRRTITFNVKPKKGTTLAKVSVRVNDKLVKVFKKPTSGKIKTQLKLTGQPRTRVKVVIRSTTTTGRSSTRTQHFVTCVPKRTSTN